MYYLNQIFFNYKNAQMKKIGRNIRRLRELRNFTQKYMAEQLAMTQGNYARIENEEIQISGERLERISNILGYSLDFMMEFDVERINDFAHQKLSNKNMYHYQISPELKTLYETRISYLENYIDELKSELKTLRDQV